MRTSLQVKWAIMLLLITSLSLSLVALGSYQLEKSTILQSQRELAEQEVQASSRWLSAWASARLSEMRRMSQSDEMLLGDDEEQFAYLKQELKEKAGEYTSLGITDASGRFRSANGEEMAIDGLAALGAARDTSVPALHFVRPSAQEPAVLALHVPLGSQDALSDRVLTATFRPDLIYSQVMRNKGESFHTWVMLQSDGTVLYDSEGSFPMLTSLYDEASPMSDLPMQAMGQPNGFIELLYRGEPHLFLYASAPAIQGYTAELIPKHAFDKAMDALFWRLVLLVLAAELALGLILFLLLNPMVRLLRQLLLMTEKAAGGHFQVQETGHSSGGELGALASGMVDNISTVLERMHALLRQDVYAIFVVDKELSVTYLNPTAQKLLGYTPDELLHKKTMFVWHDEQEIFRRAEKLSAELGERVTPDISVFLTKSSRPCPEDDQWTFVHKAGVRYTVQLSMSPMRDLEGRVTGYVGIARDISLHKKVEDTRNRLLSIFDATKDLIASVDSKGNIFYMNPAGLELLGLRELNEETKNAKQYFDSSELHHFLEGLLLLYKNGYWERETVVLTYSGLRIPMSMMLIAHKDKQGKIYYSVIGRDITEQKRIQEELLQAKQTADRANEAKSQFLARMSHEIRTPLNGVMGFSQLLMRSGLEGIQREYGTKITASSESLLRMVNDILDFSKIEAGKLQLERTRFSLDEVMLHVCDMISVLLGKKPVEILVDSPEELPGAVMGDPLRLEQIMLNLCSNALKFTEQGYILIQLQVIRRDEREVLIEFAVEDSGIGIKKEQLDRLFHPFMQADESTSRKYGGTGLGLVITKNLIELMGGTLQVHSLEGQGSKFTFQLPFEQAASGDRKPCQLPPAFQPYRVLVVQQPGKLSERLRELLHGLSLEVTMAASWSEGHTLLQKTGALYDLALLDMEAEDMYGLETWLEVQELLRRSDTVSIAMTTAYGRQEIAGLPNEQRPDCVVVKPIHRRTIVQSLRAALEHSHAPEDRFASAEAPHYHSKRQENRGHILLAEDHAINRQVAVEMLRGEGFAVTAVENGLQLLEQLGHRPDGWALILLDIQMPGMDGCEAARFIRADSRFGRLPIVALTANALPEEREACLSAGMNDVLNKPLDLQELASLLQRYAPERENPQAEAQGSMLQMDGLDMDRLLDRLNGKIPILLHLLEKFYNEYGDFTIRLREHIRREDWEAARRNVHTLKGVAASLTADRLFMAAEQLENTLKEAPTERLEQEAAVIGQEVERILDSYRLNRAAVYTEQPK